jgi:hypothetical protein
MRIALVFAVLAAAGLYAQPGSAAREAGASSVDFAESARNATDVVVAEIRSGAAVDSVTSIAATASIRVVRTLRGKLAPGAEIPLTWQYRPSPQFDAGPVNSMPTAHGLWLLTRKKGAYVPTRLPGMPFEAFVPLPATAPPGALAYGNSASYESKLAHELGFALLALSSEAEGAPQAERSRESLRQIAIIFLMRRLSPKASAPVFAALLEMPVPEMRRMLLSRLYGLFESPGGALPVPALPPPAPPAAEESGDEAGDSILAAIGGSAARLPDPKVALFRVLVMRRRIQARPGVRQRPIPDPVEQSLSGKDKKFYVELIQETVRRVDELREEDILRANQDRVAGRSAAPGARTSSYQTRESQLCAEQLKRLRSGLSQKGAEALDKSLAENGRTWGGGWIAN